MRPEDLFFVKLFNDSTMWPGLRTQTPETVVLGEIDSEDEPF